MLKATSHRTGLIYKVGRAGTVAGYYYVAQHDARDVRFKVHMIGGVSALEMAQLTALRWDLGAEGEL